MARNTYQVSAVGRFDEVGVCLAGVMVDPAADPAAEYRVEDVQIIPRGSGGWNDNAGIPLNPLPGVLDIRRTTAQSGGDAFDVVNTNDVGAAVPSQLAVAEDPGVTVVASSTLHSTVSGPMFTPTLGSVGRFDTRMGPAGKWWGRHVATNLQPITCHEGEGLVLFSATDGPNHFIGIWIVFSHGGNQYWAYRTCTLGGRDWFVGIFNGSGSGADLVIERIGMQELGTTEPPLFAVTRIDRADGGAGAWDKMDTATPDPPATVRPLAGADIYQSWISSGLPGVANQNLYLRPGQAPNSPVRITPAKQIGTASVDIDYRTMFPHNLTGQFAGLASAVGRIPPPRRQFKTPFLVRLRPNEGLAVQRTTLSAYGRIIAIITFTHVPAPAAGGSGVSRSRTMAAS